MTTTHPGSTTLPVLELLQSLREVADDPDLLDLHDPAATEREWTLLRTDADVQIWLISWPSGTGTGWHDHGTASGAFTVLRGTLTEDSWRRGVHTRILGRGEAWAFAGGHIHDVHNDLSAPALSVHAYSPRLTTMTRYQLLGRRLEATGVEKAGEEW